MPHIDNEISKKVYNLMQEIEKLPPSEHATKLVILASDILEAIEPLNALKRQL